MTDAFEHELTAHATALRQLARALVGEGAADDLLQDVALSALQQPPAVATGLRGWLVAVLRHRAHKHRRAESRRRAHEAEVPPGREPLPPDWLAAQRELVRRLDAELLALPEPYQSTLMLRFFGERMPSEIAADTGVPLATVKSRLQRGLQLLRERLDARGDGSDWRGLFASACGLHAAVAGAAATTTGVLLMASGTKLAGGVLLAALLAASLCWLQGTAPQSAAGQAPVAPPPAVAAAVDAERRPAPPIANTAAQRIDVTAPAAALAVVRGRCVDDAGAPIAGRAVELHGQPPLQTPGDAPDRAYGLWLAQHRTDAWHQRRTETAADGSFEFAVMPSPQGCELQFPGDMPAAMNVGALASRGVTDVGDIRLGAPCTLHIHVVDADHEPVATPQLVLRLAATPGAHFPLRAQPELRCETAGALTATVFAGDYAIEQTRPIRRGERIAVPAGCATFSCEVVLASTTTGEAITGCVVDGNDAPLPGVHVATRWDVSGSEARTDMNGHFVLPMPPKAGDQTVLYLRKSGYEPLQTARGYRWSEHDLRFSLRAESGIALQVVADADGSAVEDFGVHAWREDGPTRWAAWRQGLVLNPGNHPRGLSTLSLRQRPTRLLVEPERWDLWRSELVPVPPTASRTAPLVVRLPPAGERRVRLQRANRESMADADIELIDGREQPVQLGTSVCPLASWTPTSRDLLLVAQVRTDAKGEALLHGPSDRDLVLRVLLQGVPLLLEPRVRLDDPATLLLTVPPAARLLGHVTPSDLAQRLRQATAPPSQPKRLGFQLCQDLGTEVLGYPDYPHPLIALADDGTFALDPAPAGDWRLMVREITPDGTFGFGMQPVAAVHLQPGATTAVDIDLSSWLPATIDGLVRRGGEPLANAAVMLLGTRAGAGRAATTRDTIAVTTDAEGRFRAAVWPGCYRVGLDASPGPPIERVARLVASVHTLQVPPGAELQATFDIDVATLRLHLFDGAGRAVPGVPLVLVGSDAALRHQTAPSDADGWIEAFVEPGTFTVEVAPQPLRLEARLQALSWLIGRGDADPDARHRVRLGGIQAQVGEAATGDFVLPEALLR